MDKTFLAGCVCFAFVVTMIITGVTYTNTNKYKAITDMVAKGANPMAAHCALDGSTPSNQTVCTTLAAQSK
jgi:hypothetical protein